MNKKEAEDIIVAKDLDFPIDQYFLNYIVFCIKHDLDIQNPINMLLYGE